MFLNFRRSPIKYIMLWILTLGFYSISFRREITRDINIALGESKVKAPGVKHFFLNLFTFGIYGVKWDVSVCDILNHYLEDNSSDISIDTEYYGFMSKLPFVKLMVIHLFINALNEVCKIYSDRQLDDVDDDDYLSVNRVRDVNEEELYVPEEKTENRLVVLDEKMPIDDGNVHKIAGYAVVEEYDPDKDQKRISYRLRLEREARAAAREEALHPRTVVGKAEPKELAAVKQETPIVCKRNKRWIFACFVAMLVVFLVPFLIIAATFILPPVYADTFVGELGEKYDRLNRFDEPKVIIIGGSSVAFGINSELISDELDMPVVNFGLYADLGTKLMMDLSKANINEGDIIVLAPEMNPQTLSLFFNGETTLQALDGNLDMLMNIDSDDYGSLIGASFGFACDKLRYLITDTRPMNDGAYKKENFNKSGDNVYDRPYNVMTGVQNVITLDFNAKFNDNKVTEYEEYIEYVNKYVRYAKRKGATVYFSFCPMSAASMSNKNTDKTIEAFYENLCRSLECKVISNVYNYILDEGYFFDSEFHLNNAGVTVRTVRLIDDIKRALGDNSVTMNESELPEPPGYEPMEFFPEKPEDAERALDFVFEEYTHAGKVNLRIVGLTDVGKSKATLTIPNVVNGKPVREIGEFAFKNATGLTTLNLGDNIGVFAANAFNGAINLVSVYFPDHINNNNLSAPLANGDSPLATDGCNPAIKFYVSEEAYTGFMNDEYFWADYRSRFIKKST